MDKEKVLFKASPPILPHMVTTFFLLVTSLGYFFGLYWFVCAITGMITIIRMFRDDLSILIYKDKFTFRYSNYFGKLMTRNLTFYYSDIKSFNCLIEKWDPDEVESTIIVLTEFLLPGHQGSYLNNEPIAKIKITFLNNFKEQMVQDINFSFRDNKYAIALDKIDKKINNT